MEVQRAKALVAGTALEGVDKKAAEEAIPGMQFGPDPRAKAADRTMGRQEALKCVQHTSPLGRNM
jgi:hypothetical protein